MTPLGRVAAIPSLASLASRLVFAPLWERDRFVAGEEGDNPKVIPTIELSHQRLTSGAFVRDAPAVERSHADDAVTRNEIVLPTDGDPRYRQQFIDAFDIGNMQWRISVHEGGPVLRNVDLHVGY